MKANIMLAQIIEDAAEKHEKSFDKQAAEKANKEGKLVDFNTFYKVSIAEAALSAAWAKGCIELAQPAHLMLKTCWNDILDWAEVNK